MQDFVLQLKHINIQLQTRNNKLEIKMEQLREQARTLNEKIQQFNAKINPNSSEVVRLNPQQQVRMNYLLIKFSFIIIKNTLLNPNQEYEAITITVWLWLQSSQALKVTNSTTTKFDEYKKKFCINNEFRMRRINFKPNSNQRGVRKCF